MRRRSKARIQCLRRPNQAHVGGVPSEARPLPCLRSCATACPAVLLSTRLAATRASLGTRTPARVSPCTPSFHPPVRVSRHPGRGSARGRLARAPGPPLLHGVGHARGRLRDDVLPAKPCSSVRPPAGREALRLSLGSPGARGRARETGCSDAAGDGEPAGALGGDRDPVAGDRRAQRSRAGCGPGRICSRAPANQQARIPSAGRSICPAAAGRLA